MTASVIPFYFEYRRRKKSTPSITTNDTTMQFKRNVDELKKTIIIRTKEANDIPDFLFGL